MQVRALTPILHAFALVVVLNLGETVHAQQTTHLLSYQGRVMSVRKTFTGSGAFKFALVSPDGLTTYWSNDGTGKGGGEPQGSVRLPVAKGFYSVLLGDSNAPKMTPIPASVFYHAEVRLRIWFCDGGRSFQQLSPDPRIALSGSEYGAALASGAPLRAKTSPSIPGLDLSESALGGSERVAVPILVGDGIYSDEGPPIAFGASAGPTTACVLSPAKAAGLKIAGEDGAVTLSGDAVASAAEKLVLPDVKGQSGGGVITVANPSGAGAPALPVSEGLTVGVRKAGDGAGLK